MEETSLSEKVRAYILETSKTLAEICRKTGIPKTTLGPWLKGEKNISTGTFDKICQAYGIEPLRMSGENSESVWTIDQLGQDFSESERVMVYRSTQQLNAMLKRTRESLESTKNIMQTIADYLGEDK